MTEDCDSSRSLWCRDVNGEAHLPRHMNLFLYLARARPFPSLLEGRDVIHISQTSVASSGRTRCTFRWKKRAEQDKCDLVFLPLFPVRRLLSFPERNPCYAERDQLQLRGCAASPLSDKEPQAISRSFAVQLSKQSFC